MKITTSSSHLKSDYTDFDQSLLKLITNGKHTASSLTEALLTAAKPFSSKPGHEFRVVDRRLQSLRKRGLIENSRSGRFQIWTLLKE